MDRAANHEGHDDNKKSSISVNRKIRDVEARLYTNRDVAVARAIVVGDQLRDKMTSPVTLIVAGGLGFAVAHYNARPKVHSADDEEPEHHGTPVLATLMDLISLAGSVMSLLPRDNNSAPEDNDSDDSTEQP